LIKEGYLLEKISEARNKAGKSITGQSKIPMVRVRDNIELLPNQVRLRYYSEFLVDKQFIDYNDALIEIIGALEGINP